MPKDSGLEDMLIVNTLTRIDGKLDKLDDRMDTMNGTLIKQQGSLDEHIKRTNLLEQKIEVDAKTIREGLSREAAEAVRTERNKILVFCLKVAGILAGLGGGGFGLKQILPVLAKLWSGE